MLEKPAEQNIIQMVKCTKPGDGPSGTGKPEATAPPKKEMPPDEDNTPIEVEVDPDIDADIKPKKGKKKEYEKQTVWTITFKDAKASAPNQYIPKYADDNYTLNFTATKQGGGSDMLGSYTGQGFLLNEADFSRAIAQVPDFVYTMISDWEGPLEGIAFELYNPNAPKEEDDETLAPLIPPEEQLAKLHSGEADSSMTWPVKARQVHVDTAAGSGDKDASVPPMQLVYFIHAYHHGAARLKLFNTTASTPLIFKGTISKKISWKQVR